MKRIGIGLILVFMLSLGLFVFPQEKAYACSCVLSDAKEKLQSYAAVFSGKVIQVGGTKSFEHGRLRKYTFEVDTSWKGVDEKQISIYSYDGSEASCGFSFQKGKTYLVYSYQSKDTLMTNFCSGNLMVKQAQKDIQLLGAGTQVADDSADRETDHGDFNRLLSYSASGFVVAIIAFYVFWRSKRLRR